MQDRHETSWLHLLECKEGLTFIINILLVILIQCIDFNQEKVNWFTADAFCDYHGMHLMSFPLDDPGNKDQTVIQFMTCKIRNNCRPRSNRVTIFFSCLFSWHLDISK